MQRKLYPENWEEISLKVRESSGWRCECCGFCQLHRGRRCVEINGKPAQWARGKIVLTVAHLCHHPECINLDHLVALCQRCHLRGDSFVKMRALKSKRQKESKQEFFRL